MDYYHNNKIGINVKIIEPVNLYECKIGDDSLIGPFVEIQKNGIIGKRVRISSHSFICAGVTINDDVFIGHGVMFTNDKFHSNLLEDWELRTTIVEKRVRIGSNSTILPVRIGQNSIIGAGSVVTKDIPPNSVALGNPAKVIRKVK